MTLLGPRHSLLERSLLVSRPLLARSSLQLDAHMQSFAVGATDPTAIASMMMGGLTGRFLKIGMAPFASAWLRPMTFSLALCGEASAFELTSRSLRVAQGENASQLLSWSAPGGLGQGILHSIVSFAALKTAGLAAQNTNIFLQHAAQSAAFVLGHDATAALGLQEAESGSLVERLMFAELMNLQLGVSMRLLHGALPGLHILERSLDLRAHFVQPRRSFLSSSPSILPARMSATSELNLSQAPARRVIIRQEIHSGNLDAILAHAEAAQGAHLEIIPATLDSNEAYAPAIKLWTSLLPRAERYASLSMEVGGVSFRYREFPEEIVGGEVAAVKLRGSAGVGTVISLRNPAATFDRITEVLIAFRNEVDPAWRLRQKQDALPNVRVDFAESMGQVVRFAVYNYYGELRRWVHGVSDELLTISDHLKAGEPLSKTQQARVDVLSEEFRRRKTRFVDYRLIWRWAAESRIKAPEEAYEGPTVLAVLHNLNNRIAKLMSLELEFHSIQRGHALTDSVLEIFNESVHMTVASAVNEGLEIAKAMAARTHVEIEFPSGLPERFQHVLLREDIHLELAFQDLIGNLGTNNVRYHNPVLPPAERYSRLVVHFLENGGLEVTMSDNGIGILPENFDRLGETGFQEKRQHVEGSEGHGLSSVMQTLRELGWGPLWLRSVPGKGADFRFVIPPRDFEVAAAFRENPVRDTNTIRPGDPLSYFERNLEEGFLVPAASMDMAVRQMLEQIRAPRAGLGVDFNLWQGIVDGSFRYARLRALHRLLSGRAGPEGSVAVDNAYGSFADLFLTLSQMGSHVWLKEPDRDADAFNFMAVMDLPDKIKGRLHPSEPENINQALVENARVVYWCNPNYVNFALPEGAILSEYLGRDVALGGYLVIQNGRGSFDKITHSMRFNPARWQLVYQSDAHFNVELGDERVLPTSSSAANALFVYRRIQ